MKKSHLIGIAIIAIAIAVLFSITGEMGTYATFKDAQADVGRKVQVVSTLSKDKNIEYQPEKDANVFSFYAKDKDGNERKVIFKKSKPQDFERSEQIVITGAANEKGEFLASDMLLKCPSKYEKEQLIVASK